MPIGIDKMFVSGGNSQDSPAGPGKWKSPEQTTSIPLVEGLQTINPVVKRHTEIAAKYARFFHEGNHEEILALLAPTCQYGTFFGFVWGPTAITIALREEQKMKLQFVGRIMTYADGKLGSAPSSTFGSAAGFGAANKKWYGTDNSGLHTGPGAAAFVRVTPNIFERDGWAKRSHRSFPMNIFDYFQTLKVRETIVVDEGMIVARTLQNLTTWFPMPYDFM